MVIEVLARMTLGPPVEIELVQQLKKYGGHVFLKHTQERFVERFVESYRCMGPISNEGPI